MFKTHIPGHSIILHQEIRKIFSEVLFFCKKLKIKKEHLSKFPNVRGLDMLKAGADEKQLTWLTASRAMILT